MHQPDDPEVTEATEADMAEQRTPVRPADRGGNDPVPDVEVPAEADAADVVEQAMEVSGDDEDDQR